MDCADYPLFVSERFYLFDLRQGSDFTLLAGFYLGNIPFEIVHITSYILRLHLPAAQRLEAGPALPTARSFPLSSSR